jgi:hypothetical protein
MAMLRVYKRKSEDMDISELVETISESGLEDGLQKFYDNPREKETKSIVAGPSFLRFLSKLFQIQISSGDIIQFEHKSHSKYYMLSPTGTWDEIIKLG